VDASAPDHSACDPTRLARVRPTPVRARRSTPRMEVRWARRSGSRRRSSTPDSACIRRRVDARCVTFGGAERQLPMRAASQSWNAPASLSGKSDAPGVVGKPVAIGRPHLRAPSRGARRPTRSASRPGDYAMTNGKRARRSVGSGSIVEDRSEPGGTEWTAPSRPVPGCGSARGPDTSDGLTLRQAVACADRRPRPSRHRRRISTTAAISSGQPGRFTRRSRRHARRRRRRKPRSSAKGFRGNSKRWEGAEALPPTSLILAVKTRTHDGRRGDSVSPSLASPAEHSES